MKIFVGEYCSRPRQAKQPRGSAGRAAFMTGLERNSDIVHMAVRTAVQQGRLQSVGA